MAINVQGLSENVFGAVRGKGTSLKAKTMDFTEVSKRHKEKRDLRTKEDARAAQMIGSGLSDNFLSPIKQQFVDLQKKADRGEIQVGSTDWNTQFSEIENQFTISKGNYDKAVAYLAKVEANPEGFSIPSTKESEDGKVMVVTLTGEEAVKHLKKQLFEKAPRGEDGRVLDTDVYGINADFSTEMGSVTPVGADPEIALTAAAVKEFDKYSVPEIALERKTPGGLTESTTTRDWDTGELEKVKLTFEKENLRALQDKHALLAGRGEVTVTYDQWAPGYIDDLLTQKKTEKKIIKDESDLARDKYNLDAAKFKYNKANGNSNTNPPVVTGYKVGEVANVPGQPEGEPLTSNVGYAAVFAGKGKLFEVKGHKMNEGELFMKIGEDGKPKVTMTGMSLQIDPDDPRDMATKIIEGTLKQAIPVEEPVTESFVVGRFGQNTWNELLAKAKTAKTTTPDQKEEPKEETKKNPTEADFNAVWGNLKKGESTVGPDGKTYIKQ